MSTVHLKLVALLVMTIDHLGLVFGQQGWNLLPVNSLILRLIGRSSFPLFAFCLAQGWKRTRNRKAYFINLVLGALVSQIPFTMAFSADNMQKANAPAFALHISGEYFFLTALALFLYWRFVLDRHFRPSMWIIAAAAILPAIQLQICGVWILGRNTNIFYTFVMAFLCLYLLSPTSTLRGYEKNALVFCIGTFLLAYGVYADYGTCLAGIVLIVGFALFDKKVYQITVLVAWSVLYYAILSGNLKSAVACSLSGIYILLYRPELVPRHRMKKLFYFYYPLHLLGLGIFNAVMKGGMLR